MISRHEMRERGEALNRMMAEADERNAKLNAKLNQEADRDAKIAQLMASATATARATQFALDSTRVWENTSWENTTTRIRGRLRVKRESRFLLRRSTR